MKKLVVLSLAVLLAPALAAQQRDTSETQRDTAEAGRLRAQIEAAFNDRVQQDLKLSSGQATKLRATQEKFGAQRRALMQQQQERRRALDDQMQPGVAANSDSVRKLMDGMRDGRAQLFRIEQDEDQEMSGYLTPVQRARYQEMRTRLMERVQQMRLERRDNRGMGQGMPQPRPRLRGGRRGRGF